MDLDHILKLSFLPLSKRFIKPKCKGNRILIAKKKGKPRTQKVKCLETERHSALYPYVWFVLWLCFTDYVPDMSTFVFSSQKIITGRKKVVLLSIIINYNKTTLNLLHVIQLSVQLRSTKVWWHIQSYWLQNHKGAYDQCFHVSANLFKHLSFCIKYETENYTKYKQIWASACEQRRTPPSERSVKVFPGVNILNTAKQNILITLRFLRKLALPTPPQKNELSKMVRS